MSARAGFGRWRVEHVDVTGVGSEEELPFCYDRLVTLCDETTVVRHTEPVQNEWDGDPGIAHSFASGAIVIARIGVGAPVLYSRLITRRYDLRIGKDEQ
jgi:hypothetical protein